MEILKHKIFYQWAKSEGLTDNILKQAIREMELSPRGYEASLGSGL